MELKDYQVKAVEFLRTHPRGLLESFAGSGKTACAIKAVVSLVKNINCEKPVKILIVCPASLRSNWWKEIELWGDISPYMFEWSVVSFQGLHKICKGENVDSLYSIIIVDESHKLKNPLTQTFNYFKRLLNKKTICWFLTATAYPKSGADGFIYYYFNGGKNTYPAFANKFAFIRDYEVTGKNGRRKKLKLIQGFKDIDGLRGLLAPYTHKIVKKDVLSQLNKTYETVIHVEITDKQLLKDCKAVDPKDLQKEVEPLHIAELRQRICYQKLNALHDFVEGFDRRLIIFNVHRAVGDEIVTVLEKDVPTFIYRGGMNDSEKDAVIEKFESHEKAVLVLSIGAGGVGLNLQKSDAVMFFELGWTWAEVYQAIGRVDRIGQQNSINVWYMLGTNTIDDVIHSKVQGMRRILT